MEEVRLSTPVKPKSPNFLSPENPGPGLRSNRIR